VAKEPKSISRAKYIIQMHIAQNIFNHYITTIRLAHPTINARIKQSKYNKNQLSSMSSKLDGCGFVWDMWV